MVVCVCSAHNFLCCHVVVGQHRSCVRGWFVIIFVDIQRTYALRVSCKISEIDLTHKQFDIIVLSQILLSVGETAIQQTNMFLLLLINSS